MSSTVFQQVLQLVQQLTPEERVILNRYLEATSSASSSTPVTREMLLAEHAALRAAGAFDHVTSLRGKYARPGLDLSEEELESYLHEVATQWEEDLDELLGED